MRCPRTCAVLTSAAGSAQKHVSVFDTATGKYYDVPQSTPNVTFPVPTAGVAATMSRDGTWLHIFGGSLGHKDGACIACTCVSHARSAHVLGHGGGVAHEEV